MDFEYTAEENGFREEIKAFLKENLPPKKERDKNFLKSWLEKVREKGWVGFSWPKEYDRLSRPRMDCHAMANWTRLCRL